MIVLVNLADISGPQVSLILGKKINKLNFPSANSVSSGKNHFSTVTSINRWKMEIYGSI